ncbi:hypothetical protein ACSBR2_021869 [Camellia fascicularis]
MNAGAVMLTDCVFWFIIVSFLAIKDYDLNFAIDYKYAYHQCCFSARRHCFELLGMLQFFYLDFNSYFASQFNLLDLSFSSGGSLGFELHTFSCGLLFMYILKWIVHACVSLWWPYPFLDLSSTCAPLWYVINLKKSLL